MLLKPIDEQIIVIRLGADHEFKSRFPHVILPDVAYHDPSGFGIVHDFDDCDSIQPGLKPLRELIKKGDLIRFTRSGTGRKFMDVTGIREIVTNNENGYPTTYSFIRREHLLAVIEGYEVDQDPVTGEFVVQSPRQFMEDVLQIATLLDETNRVYDPNTVAANKALQLVKYGLLDQDDFEAVYGETGFFDVYREPDDDEDISRTRKCYINYDPESETSKRIETLLSDKLRVTQSDTNIYLVAPDEIARYLATRDSSQFHCYISSNRTPVTAGADWSTSEIVELIQQSARIAITTGDAYLHNLRHALAVIVNNQHYLFDIGIFNTDNLEIIES